MKLFKKKAKKTESALLDASVFWFSQAISTKFLLKVCALCLLDKSQKLWYN